MNIKPLTASIAILVLTFANTAARAADDLTGAIWASQSDYQWMVVSDQGDVQTFTSTGHYLEVLQKHGEVYAVKIAWWNGLTNELVEEYGVMIPMSESMYRYQEAGTVETTKGMLGVGYLTIVDGGSAEFSKIGARQGGSVSALVNTLERVETAPQLGPN